MEKQSLENAGITPTDPAGNPAVQDTDKDNRGPSGSSEGVLRLCSVCGRILPAKRKSDTCRACEDYDLFMQIRQYISDHQAMNYHEIAHDFHISEKRALHFVRRKIEEQNETEEGTLEELFSSDYCTICGEPVVYGNLCPACSRERYRMSHPKTMETPGDTSAGLRHLGTEKRNG